MSSPEEGEIEDDTPSLQAAPINNYSMLGQKAAGGASSVAETAARGYRSTARPVNSSSESSSDGEEDTPMWRQKQEKFFRKNQHTTHCPSPTLPEFTPASKNGSGSATAAAAKKKSNNIWGSVLTEQDLTTALVQDASVDKSRDNFRERNVESYDFTNKYKDTRPENDEEEQEDDPAQSHDPFHKVLKSTTQTFRGREVIGYEDTLYGGGKKTNNSSNNNSRKRKAAFGREEGKSGVHKRLGAKKVATVKVGTWIVNEDMELQELATKIAEYIHEPKVELIARVGEHMGKDVAIRILNQTRDIEDGGGMLTQDGSRRRTPGGVYLQLLKQQPEYNKDMYNRIFVEDAEWKVQQKQHRKQRKRQNRKARKQDAKRNASGSRSRSASSERCNSDQDDNNMETDKVQKQSKSESPGEKMDYGEEKSEKEPKYRKSRSHSQSAESGELKKSQSQDRENTKPKSKRSKSFSTYSEDEEDQDESTFKSQGSKKSGDYDFQKELEIAKTLITKAKSKTGEECAEMEEVGANSGDEMNDELLEAEANVIDIPLDG